MPTALENQALLNGAGNQNYNVTVKMQQIGLEALILRPIRTSFLRMRSIAHQILSKS